MSPARKKPTPANGVWVLMECSMEASEDRVLSLFDDESIAAATRDYCQNAVAADDKCMAYYRIECLPVRSIRMPLAAIMRRTTIPDVFAERKLTDG